MPALVGALMVTLALAGAAFAQVYCPGCSPDFKAATPGVQWAPQEPPPRIPYNPVPSVTPQPTYPQP